LGKEGKKEDVGERLLAFRSKGLLVLAEGENVGAKGSGEEEPERDEADLDVCGRLYAESQKGETDVLEGVSIGRRV